MKYFLLFLLIWMAFQFVFRFLLPLFMAGRQLRKGFRHMQEQMQDQLKKQQGSGSQYRYTNRPETPASKSSNEAVSGKASVPKIEDYIDFEEVKKSGGM